MFNLENSFIVLNEIRYEILILKLNRLKKSSLFSKCDRNLKSVNLLPMESVF